MKTCWGISLSPDGSRLIVGSDEKLARVFDMKTGKLLNELRGPAAGAAFLPDGKRAVTGGGDSADGTPVTGGRDDHGASQPARRARPAGR